MVLNEIGYLGYLSIIEDATVLNDRITVSLDKELGRTALRELAVTGMDMHTLDHAERSEIQVIARHLKIVVLRHDSILHVFLVLL